MITLDIDTKVTSSDQRIWAIFPGLARRYFSLFQDNNLVFLDTPDLNLTHDAISSDIVLKQHVSMSLAWKRYYLGGGDRIPSSNPADYEPPKDRTFAATFGNVKSLFNRMREGDLVLVGQYDIYSPVLIGEVVGPFSPDIWISLPRYDDARIPARAVGWLRTSKERRFLSRDLSKLLSNSSVREVLQNR